VLQQVRKDALQRKVTKKRKYSSKLLYWEILAILSFSLSGLPSLASKVPDQFQILERQSQENPEREPAITPSSTAPGLNDPQEFEAFIDKFFNEEMSKSHAAGAAIAVVKNEKLFFAKGYGYANVEKKIPVVADKTLFRVASLSKLVTATAAMQLYERGLLQLDAPVNLYSTNHNRPDAWIAHFYYFGLQRQLLVYDQAKLRRSRFANALLFDYAGGIGFHWVPDLLESIGVPVLT